jgi:hypothetical protein
MGTICALARRDGISKLTGTPMARGWGRSDDVTPWGTAAGIMATPMRKTMTSIPGAARYNPTRRATLIAWSKRRATSSFMENRLASSGIAHYR